MDTRSAFETWVGIGDDENAAPELTLDEALLNSLAGEMEASEGHVTEKEKEDMLSPEESPRKRKLHCPSYIVFAWVSRDTIFRTATCLELCAQTYYFPTSNALTQKGDKNELDFAWSRCKSFICAHIGSKNILGTVELYCWNWITKA